MSRTVWLVLLGLVAVAMASGLGSLGLVDYDEAVYAQVSWEMAERGDLIHPTLQGEGWYEKPPFVYWTQIAGYAVLGKNEWAVRILNVLGALLGAVFLAWTVGASFGERRAQWASLMFLTSAFTLGLSQLALTDMWLTTWLVLAVGSTLRAIHPWEQGGKVHKGWWALASVACGLAMLTKGAIGLLLPAGALFFYLVATKRLHFIRQAGLIAWGLALAVGIGFSWYLLLGITAEGGFAFMGELFMEHHVGRFLNPMQGHKGSLFFYVPIVLLGLVPWLPYVLGGMNTKLRSRLNPDAQRTLLLFGIFAGLTFVFFSVAATKLPNYVAPVFPALSLFGAVLLDDERKHAERNESPRTWLYKGQILALLVVAALAMCHVSLTEWAQTDPHRRALRELPGLAQPFDAGAGPYALGGLAMLIAGLVYWLWKQIQPRMVAVVLALGSAAILATCAHMVFPRYDRHFQAPLRYLATHAATSTGPDERILMLGIRHRPSMLFYGTRGTEYFSVKHPEKLKAALAESAPRVGIVRTREEVQLVDVATVQRLQSSGGWSLVRVSSLPDTK